MNLETGQMGTLDEVIRDAKPGERVIPATIIPASGKYANKKGYTPRPRPLAWSAQSTAPVYGPRKPLREVRAELQAATTEA